MYSCILIVIFISLLLVLTACQPTPAQEIVIDKNNNSIEPKAGMPVSSDDGDSLHAILGAPAQWTETIQGNNGNVTFNIDAPVKLPATTKIPIAHAKLKNFTQEDVDLVAKVLLGEDATYREYTTETKESLENRILSIRQELQSTDNSEHDYHEQLEERLLELEKAYAEAPSTSDLADVKPILKEGFLAPGADADECEGFCVSADSNGHHYIYQGYNNLYGYVTYISLNDGYGDFMATSGDKPFGVTISKEDAADQAQSVVSQIAPDYDLSYVGCAARNVQETVDKWGWACVFMRTIQGVPTAYASDEVGENIDDTNTAPVGYEKITVIVNESGILSFRWDSPMIIDSIQIEQAGLLNFEEIETLALNTLNTKYTDQLEKYKRLEISVESIELGLMRVKQPNSGAYCYTPVWNIFSEITSATLADGTVQSFNPPQPYDEVGTPLYLTNSFPEVWGPITLNAVDGSTIDRNQGY